MGNESLSKPRRGQARASKQPKWEHSGYRLEAELMRQVRQKSLDTGIPVNAYIEAALRAWVEDEAIGTVKPGRRRDLGPDGKVRGKA